MVILLLDYSFGLIMNAMIMGNARINKFIRFMSFMNIKWIMIVVYWIKVKRSEMLRLRIVMINEM